MKVLFVCTGNTCRSPMAKEIATKILNEKGIDAEVSSAGIYAFTGSAASENSIKVMEEIDIDLSGHVANMLDDKMIAESDIILAMTKGHKDAIEINNKEFQDKVFTLGEYIGTSEDILDPFGGDVDVYRSCRDQLVKCINTLLDKLNNM